MPHPAAPCRAGQAGLAQPFTVITTFHKKHHCSIIMLSNCKITTTKTIGHGSGTDFDDVVGIPNINTTAISQIFVTYNRT